FPRPPLSCSRAWASLRPKGQVPRMSDAHAVIEESLERLAERAGDPTAEVYARLFVRYPEMEALFVRDVDGAVKGEMLAKVFECALDLSGPNAYAANFIACEVVNHD